MNPRRLIPLVAVLAVLVAAYAFLTWHQERREKAEEAARRLFEVKAAEITEVTLKKENTEIRLAKKDKDWQLLAPLADLADQDTVQSLVDALAYLGRERDLGEGQDSKSLGLAPPAFVVSFTAQGKTHTLAFGSRTPGDQGYYALRDQGRNVLVVSAASKDTLDRPLADLRDKSLFHFAPDQARALRLKAKDLNLDLELTGNTWRWLGREQFKVRRDRVETLLRYLSLARAKAFVAEASANLTPYGLAPQPELTVTVVGEGKKEESLAVGSQQPQGYYARRDAAGPVVLVDANLVQKLKQASETLEDRRLWTGDLAGVNRLVWGLPGQTWTAVKEKDVWKLTGPAGQGLSLPALRLELALLKLQELQGSLAAGAPSPEKKGFQIELFDAAGKPIFRLQAAGETEKGQVSLLLKQADREGTARVDKAPYEQLLGDLDRLTKKEQEGQGGAS